MKTSPRYDYQVEGSIRNGAMEGQGLAEYDDGQVSVIANQSYLR